MGSNKFEGRTAVVTGGARGIGDAIIQAMRAEGADVVSLDKIKPEQARAGVRYLEADVSDSKSVDAAFAAIDRESGSPDILVNNAGIQRVGLIGKLGFEDWQAVIGTHLTGFFLCASQAVPRMVRHGKGGAIISIASTAAFVGIPGRGPYCAAKAGIMGLTRTLALEVASVGIRVNAIAPGYTRTKLVDEALKNGSLKEEWMLERVPMQRLASPGEIAGIACFLASEAAAYITGQVIVADGGWTIQGQSRAPDWLTTPQSAE
jgi:NAD(P)-dependent dehydrogenase (short-subunit alcohol dehydrogenase family)